MKRYIECHDCRRPFAESYMIELELTETTKNTMFGGLVSFDDRQVIKVCKGCLAKRKAAPKKVEYGVVPEL